MAELIENHLAGLMVAYLDREAGYTFAHVDDVARALLLAYERGEEGESYMVSGEPASFEVLSRLTGVPEPRFQVPGWLVDVPADLTYLVSADDLGWIGRFGLLGAPLFTLGSGAYLTYAGYRGLRAPRWATMIDPEQ